MDARSQKRPWKAALALAAGAALAVLFWRFLAPTLALAAGAAASLAAAIDGSVRQDGALHVVATGPGRGEIGFAPRAGAAARARAGDFAPTGALPLNTHGGLLSFGHCGVAGGMAHTVEAWRQMTGQAGERQIRAPRRAFIHADGGVMSSHVSLILSTEG